jgi:DNA (cytosine-5)-methyltransferase 1
MYTIGSLFSGIGGFELGFERTGKFETKWQVEIDDYATKILKRHWPDVHRERDIRQCGRHNLERVDCIIGGFPCQDISYAGKGAGLEGARSGLFFEAIRLVCELRPRAVVLENVAGLLTRGLDRVLGTLASFGFDGEWHCIPAAAVGAPHIRDRVFILAYRNGESAFAEHAEVAQLPSGDVANTSCRGSDVQGVASDTRASQKASEQNRKNDSFQTRAICSNVADTKKHGRHKGKPDRGRVQAGIGAGQECGLRDGGETVPDTNSDRREGRGQDGQPSRPLGLRSRAGSDEIQRVRLAFADWWATEPDVGRVAHGVPKRVDRLRCLGNAIVPQVAEVVAYKLLNIFEPQNDRQEPTQ